MNLLTQQFGVNNLPKDTGKTIKGYMQKTIIYTTICNRKRQEPPKCLSRADCLRQ